MKIYKTYKYKLKLTVSQEKTCDSWLNACRALYNLALEERKLIYELSKKSIHKYYQYNQLPLLRKDFKWLKEVPYHSLQNTLNRVDKSFKKFFKGDCGYPKFSKKGDYKSITFNAHFTINNKTIKIPKLREINYHNSREILGTPKIVTIVKENNNWFVCITTESPSPYKTIDVDNQDAIGIDCGASRFLSLSNNTFIDSPEFKKPFEKQIKILQRKLSRQTKGSNSRNKTKCKLRKIHVKISNQRLDFLHKVSTTLSNNYSSIYMEDLNLQKMQINSKKLGDVNYKLADNGFSHLKKFLSYKLIERGKHLGLVNPAYTSQTCSACKAVDKKSRLSQEQFVCTGCGFIDNADINASKNIMSKGIAQVTQRKTLV